MQACLNRSNLVRYLGAILRLPSLFCRAQIDPECWTHSVSIRSRVTLPCHVWRIISTVLKGSEGRRRIRPRPVYMHFWHRGRSRIFVSAKLQQPAYGPWTARRLRNSKTSFMPYSARIGGLGNSVFPPPLSSPRLLEILNTKPGVPLALR